MATKYPRAKTLSPQEANARDVAAFQKANPTDPAKLNWQTPDAKPADTSAAPGANPPPVLPPPVAKPDDGTGVLTKPYTDEQRATDENSIIDTRTKQAQGVIDAINQQFNTQITSETQAGSERANETNAENVARGLVGSPNAASSLDATDRATRGNLSKIEANRAVAITGILKGITDNAVTEAETRHQDALTQGQDIQVAKDAQKAKAKTLFSQLALQGVDLDSLKAKDPNRYKQILDQTGWDEFEATMQYNDSKNAATAIQWSDKATHYDATRGVMVMVGFDPVTKQMVEKDFPVGGKAAASGQYVPKMFGKQLFLVPKLGIDPTKPLDGQMIPYGTTGQFSPSTAVGNPDDYKEIAQGIIEGKQPPDLKALYGKSAAVRAELQRQGYDLSKAQEDWTATQKYLASLNSTQQLRLRQAIQFSSDSLDVIDQLNNAWQGGGFPKLNKLELNTAKSGVANSDLPQPVTINIAGKTVTIKDKQTLATLLDAQIGDLTSELGTVYKGGNSSTDESLALAAKNLGSDWSYETLKSAIDLSRTNLSIRQNSMKTVGAAGVSSDSPYTPGGNTSSNDQTYNAGDKVYDDSGNAYTVGDDGQTLIPDGGGGSDFKDGSSPTSFNSTAKTLAEAIKTHESGGNYEAKGGSGENGAYQFMPSTWKGWAKQYLGNASAPMTPANQDKVAVAHIQQLLDMGYTPKQVALIWNGGTPQVKRGVNKYGVRYDSGAYADKVQKIFDQISKKQA